MMKYLDFSFYYFTYTMAHRKIFNGAFCCGNTLQIFESLSKTCKIVARILLELGRVTSSQNVPRRTEISHVDSHVNRVRQICRLQVPGL